VVAMMLLMFLVVSRELMEDCGLLEFISLHQSTNINSVHNKC